VKIVKGYRLYVELNASQVRRRLKGHGLGVRKVETAGSHRAVIIHTATGQHLRQLEALFRGVIEQNAETKNSEVRQEMTNPQGSATDDVAFESEPGVLRVFQTKEATRAYYNKIAKVYDLLSEEAEKPMREAGIKKLAARPGERILEVGFGTGHCLVEIARAVGPSGKVLGIDISDQMLAHAQALLTKEGMADRAELTCGDAEQLPFESNGLDGIFFSFTLELFDTPELPKVLSECKRALRPGGRIVVVAVSREGKHGVMLNLYEWTHKHFPNLMDCRPIYVRRALEASGFTIKEADVESMWVPVEIVLAEKP